ncbi:MAG: hypothetical protein WDA70_03270 [Lysobacteraceae bacterium]
MNAPEPVQPAFDFSTAPEPVRLFEGEASISRNGAAHAATAEVMLRFTPIPRVVIGMDFEIPLDTSLSWSFCDSSELSFHLEGRAIEGYRGKYRVDNGHMALDWHPSREPWEVGDERATELHSVVTHLFNFPDFRGAHHFSEGNLPARRLLLLESEVWQVSIQSLPGKATEEAWKRIKGEGGCLLTHVAKLERRDGSNFSVEDAKKQIVMLSDFLSLVAGSHLWAICEVGLDVSGNRIWQSFCAPRPGNPAYSWASKQHGHQIEALFPFFVRRWTQSEDWEDCLHHAIYWYNQANTRDGQPGVDSGLILIQAALERLAFHHAVMERKLVSREGFKDLKRTSDKLRMLFSSVGIPLEIPASLSTLHTVAKKNKWIDAPHAITEVRNSLVHPDNKKSLIDCCPDVWSLSLWYLELSILAMCGYEGTFQNHFSSTHEWHVEQVPWAIGGEQP